MIGNGVTLRGSTIHLGDNCNKIIIGNRVNVGAGANITALESTNVRVGADCMFSTNIQIKTSDAHSIIDMETNKRYNAARSIVIGKHVWLGAGVTCLKGVTIGNNAVVGSNSVLIRGKYKGNCVYAGNPAKVIRENCCWITERVSCDKEIV